MCRPAVKSVLRIAIMLSDTNIQLNTVIGYNVM